MAITSSVGTKEVIPKPCISSLQRISKPVVVNFGGQKTDKSCTNFKSLSCISSKGSFSQNLITGPWRSERVLTKAMQGVTDHKETLPGLPIDLRGKRAFVAGVADSDGYGWAIAKSLAAAGAEILVGTWVPAFNMFKTSLYRGKYDDSRVLPDGSMMEIKRIYPLDVMYDSPEDVPDDVKTNRLYSSYSKWTVKEVAECIKQEYGSIDILVHSLANGPEVTNPLLKTSRKGYLSAISASSYSFVSLLQHCLPIMNPGGATVSISYYASQRVVPGYGGGMPAAKAGLESDTKVLAFEAGRQHKIRVNTIAAGPIRSRAGRAGGGFTIDMLIDYTKANAPLQQDFKAEDVGNAAAFLLSPLASAITGSVWFVDNGLSTMGVAVDSPSFRDFFKAG